MMCAVNIYHTIYQYSSQAARKKLTNENERKQENEKFRTNERMLMMHMPEKKWGENFRSLVELCQNLDFAIKMRRSTHSQRPMFWKRNSCISFIFDIFILKGANGGFSGGEGGEITLSPLVRSFICVCVCVCNERREGVTYFHHSWKMPMFTFYWMSMKIEMITCLFKNAWLKGRGARDR